MSRFFYILIIAVILIAGMSFLPSEKKIITTANVDMPFDAIARLITQPKEWSKWWPGEKTNDSIFTFQDKKLTVQIILQNGFKAKVTDKNISILLDFQSIATYNNATACTLTAAYSFSANPFIKAYQYLNVNQIQKAFRTLFNKMNYFFSNVEQVYGYDIQMQKVPNSSLVAIKQPYNHYPTYTEIYGLIDELKAYIAEENGKVMNAPILNISKEDNTHYLTMVAIASDRDIPSKGKFMLKNMMLGNIVVAEVQGGQDNIEKCKDAVKKYVQDYRKVSPAVFFERMITDRLKEKDSTRWMTTINYPVFN